MASQLLSFFSFASHQGRIFLETIEHTSADYSDENKIEKGEFGIVYKVMVHLSNSEVCRLFLSKDYIGKEIIMSSNCVVLNKTSRCVC